MCLHECLHHLCLQFLCCPCKQNNLQRHNERRVRYDRFVSGQGVITKVSHFKWILLFNIYIVIAENISTATEVPGVPFITRLRVWVFIAPIVYMIICRLIDVNPLLFPALLPGIHTISKCKQIWPIVTPSIHESPAWDAKFLKFHYLERIYGAVDDGFDHIAASGQHENHAYFSTD